MQKIILFIIFICFYHLAPGQHKIVNYYLSNKGDDRNNGSKYFPWKTIERLNHQRLQAGDSVIFNSGETFTGSIWIDSLKKGNKDKPVVFTSNGKQSAEIFSKDSTGCSVYKTAYIQINRLNFKGAGRKKGNIKNGVFIVDSRNVKVNNLDIQGFQKAGLEIYSSKNITAIKINAHDNGAAGISISGDYANKISTKNVLIRDCIAENNPGDPTNLTNHSGNGIIAGFCTNVTIEYCMATNNGWDMPRIGNGPVGIWTYESDSVLIQHCISYRNKTSKGGEDGGGFDLDGGVTNSIIQYCLSYENYGSAFGVFQYYEAGPWYNNTIRFCISENDGLVSAAHAGIYIWNAQKDSTNFHHFYFYNNTIFNNKGAAINYAELSKNHDFYFLNNIFVARDSLIIGKETNGIFLGNDWWSKGKFSIEHKSNLKEWARAKHKEILKERFTGLQVDPLFKAPGNTTLTDPRKLNQYTNYQLGVNSVLRHKGIDLRILGINSGKFDFNGKKVVPGFVGACVF